MTECRLPPCYAAILGSAFELLSFHGGFEDLPSHVESSIPPNPPNQVTKPKFLTTRVRKSARHYS